MQGRTSTFSTFVAEGGSIGPGTLISQNLPVSRGKLLELSWDRHLSSGPRTTISSLEKPDLFSYREATVEAGPGSFNRVKGGFSPPLPTPPDMRVRIRRFPEITGP